MKGISLVLLAVLTALGCRYPNEFKNVEHDKPHAVLHGTEYSNSGRIFATHINGQPTSFWRSSDMFRIPQGTHLCEIAFSDRTETIGYAPVQFAARAGAEYVITRGRVADDGASLSANAHPVTPNGWVVLDRRDRAIVQEIKPDGAKVVVGETMREDYVFGAPSAEAAISEYRKK